MITDFLFDSSMTSEELKAALRVVRKFKSHESAAEWLAIRFDAWAKLEQLEEFLDFLVGDGDLADDTIEYIGGHRTPKKRVSP